VSLAPLQLLIGAPSGFGTKHDALVAARNAASGRGGLVAHVDQLLADETEQLRLELQGVGHLRVREARHVALSRKDNPDNDVIEIGC
jgi:hypothetical protein